jgi:hypothetical protein
VVPHTKAGLYSNLCDIDVSLNHRGLPSGEGVFLLSFEGYSKRDSLYVFNQGIAGQFEAL